MVTIELPDEDALVLFELLARHDERESASGAEMTKIQIEDPAERWALLNLHGALECTLVAPFDPDYRTLVAAARKAVRVRVGLEDDAV